MVITRVSAVSVAKVAAVLYAGIGLLIGGFISLIGMAGVGSLLAGSEGSGLFTMLFGVGAIVIMPILYGVFGFIGTFIFASLFNVAARMTGGIEIETK
jgi:hypothetical protein